MNRVLVLITLSDSGIETIKSNPELPKKGNGIRKSMETRKYFGKIFYIRDQKRCCFNISEC
ncbi:MAG: hypothetical protein IPI90_20320 [Saprospiraceae bacterium]|nr:hypothetical protein [Candidatus Vicinibacter affinis]